MATYESSLIIRLLDRVSGPASSIRKTLAGLDRSMSGRRGIIGGIDRMAAATRGLNAAALGIGGRVLAPLAAGYGGARIVGVAMDTETALTSLGIVAGVSADRLAAAKAEIQGMAPALGVAQGELYRVLETLIAGGMSWGQALEVLPKVVKTAKASATPMEDVAMASLAVGQNLGVAASEMQRAFDYMVAGGKMGSFELKEMAREFPAMAAAAARVGMTGTEAVADLAAMAQIARKTSASSAEAANNMVNFFDKLSSPITRKKFAKFGIDVRKVFEDAKRDGRSFSDAIIDEVERVSKGDPFVISELFEDKQARDFLNAMIANSDQAKQLRADVRASTGAVEQDFKRVAETTREAWNRAGAAIENAAEKLGTKLAPAMSATADAVERIATNFGGFLDDAERRYGILDRLRDASNGIGKDGPIQVGGELGKVVDDFGRSIDAFERDVLGLPPPNEVVEKWLLGGAVSGDPSRDVAANALKRMERLQGEVAAAREKISAAELKALEAPTRAAKAEAKAEADALRAEIRVLEATIADARGLAGRMGGRDMAYVEAGNERAAAGTAAKGRTPPGHVQDRKGAARLWDVTRNLVDTLIDRASDDAQYLVDRLDRAHGGATGGTGQGNLEAALNRMTRRNERPNPRAAARMRATGAGGSDFATPSPRGVGTGGDASGFALPVPRPEQLGAAGRAAGEAFKAGIATGVTGAATEADAANARISGAFSALPPQLHASGLEAALQLAAGIRAGIPQVSAAATEAASAVAAKFPQSPAREGPLRHLVSMGAKIGEQLAQGMNEAPVARAANKMAAAAAGVAGAAPAARRAAGSSGPMAGGPITINASPRFVINGAGDPRQTAEAIDRMITSDIAERMRGIFADYGIA
ncbi:phage tail tape measure protein [Pseudoxanthobacter sp. M-2]|uniref:phage tail tape measure protein n=1 Tax=Pseudoxanthobacter sp. M-2 TaxID=3078754 RepID=UPI0038FBF2CD